MLLEKARDFQRSQKLTHHASGKPDDTVDGDNVYFHFVICCTSIKSKLNIAKMHREILLFKR